MIQSLWADPLTQGIGLLGTLCGMLWAVCPGRRGMLLVQCATSVFFAGHYALLGAVTGCAMNVLSALQAGLAVPLGTRPGFRLVYLAMVVPIAAGLLLTWGGLPSLFAALGTLLLTIGRYQLDVVRFRALMALGLPCWFAHNLLVGSVPGLMSDVIGMTINGVMLMRALMRRPGVAAVSAGEGA